MFGAGTNTGVGIVLLKFCNIYIRCIYMQLRAHMHQCAAPTVAPFYSNRCTILQQIDLKTMKMSLWKRL